LDDLFYSTRNFISNIDRPEYRRMIFSYPYNKP